MAKPTRKSAAPSETPQETETVEWIVTAKRDTGEVVKVERVDEETGERHELTAADYLAAYGMDPSADPYLAAWSAYYGDPYQAGAVDPYSGGQAYGWW